MNPTNLDGIQRSQNEMLSLNMHMGDRDMSTVGANSLITNNGVALHGGDAQMFGISDGSYFNQNPQMINRTDMLAQM